MTNMSKTANSPQDGDGDGESARNPTPKVLNQLADYLKTLDGANGAFLDKSLPSQHELIARFFIIRNGVPHIGSQEDFELTDAVRELQQVTLRLMRDLEIVRRAQGVHGNKIDTLKADLDTAISIACELDKRLIDVELGQKPDAEVFAAWDKNRERGLMARLHRFVKWLFFLD